MVMVWTIQFPSPSFACQITMSVLKLRRPGNLNEAVTLSGAVNRFEAANRYKAAIVSEVVILSEAKDLCSCFSVHGLSMNCGDPSLRSG